MSLCILKPQYKPHFLHCGLPDIVNSAHLTCRSIQCWAPDQEFQWDFHRSHQPWATDLTEHHCDILKQVKI